MTDKTKKIIPRKVMMDNLIQWKVYCLEDLFFYSLYNFNAYFDVTVISDKKSINKILNCTNYDLTGYKLRLTSNYLKHFYGRHFNEKDRSQRSFRFQDLKKLGDIVTNCWTASNVDIDTILFEKRFPTGTFQLVVEVNDKKKVLIGKSFRIKT